MPRQAITPQPYTKEALLNPTYSTLTGASGIEFQNTGHEVVAVINGSTASTATVNVATEIDGQSVTPFSVTLPVSNTAPQFLGPFDSHFTQADGNVYIDLTSVTGLTVAVLQMVGVS